MSATISVRHTTADHRPSWSVAPRRATGRRAATTRPIARTSARPSPATYRRRRAGVGIVLAVLVAVGAVLTHDVLAGSGGVPASAAVSQPARTRTTVTARPGDTLWAIADRHRGEIPISRYVDTLVDLNGGASIQAGQAVVLP